jgi:hypothetical protein
MTLENDLIQAGRTWVKNYGNPAGAIGDAQVKNASLTFQRPQLDYVVVSCIIVDRALSALGDEHLHGVSGVAPTLIVGGKREAVLRFQAFGATSVEWLSNLKLSLSRPGVMSALDALGVSFVPETPVTNIDMNLGAVREQRAFFDVVANYRIRTSTLSTAQGIVAATSVDLSVDFTETSGGAPVLELDTTITL